MNGKQLWMVVMEAEVKAILLALTHSDGNKSEAARVLGISYCTIARKIRQNPELTQFELGKRGGVRKKGSAKKWGDTRVN